MLQISNWILFNYVNVLKAKKMLVSKEQYELFCWHFLRAYNFQYRFSYSYLSRRGACHLD